MKHKKSKHSLDEMQDHNLLKIEELGFWLSFWVSFVVIVVQVLAGASLKEIAGEIIILFTTHPICPKYNIKILTNLHYFFAFRDKYEY